MSMNNAQIALLAAAATDVTGDLENVYYLQERFEKFLDSQDKKHVARDPWGGRRACGHTSTHGSVCTKEEHPASDHHENSLDGVRWLEKPATVQAPAAKRKVVVHFTPSPGARHTACGRRLDELAEGAQISLKVGNTTCTNCKEELGL